MAFMWSRRSSPPTRMGGIIQILIGVTLLTAGVGFGISQFMLKDELEDLRDFGQRVRGEVVGARHETRRSKNSTSHYYYVTVQYRHTSGVEVVKELEADAMAFGRYAAASTSNRYQAAVLCAYNDPNSFTIEEAVQGQITRKEHNSLAFLCIGGLIGVILMATGYWTYARAAQYAGIPPGGYAPGTRWGPQAPNLPPGYATPTGFPPAPPGYAPQAPQVTPYKPLNKRQNPKAAPWEDH